MATKLPHYELKVSDGIEDYDNWENIYMTSLVSDPATERNWAVFSKDSDEKSKELNPKPMIFKGETEGTFERIISGVWFTPDTPIYRRVGDYEFTASITAEELKKALKQYLKLGYAKNHNVQHMDSMTLWNSVETIEHWIIEDKDMKSPIMGYTLSDLGYKKSEIPLGTVMKTVYIKDEELFDNFIKKDQNGNSFLNGYSIEAFFQMDEQFKKHIEKMNKIMDKNKEMFAALGLNQSKGELMLSNDKTLRIDEKIFDGETEVVDGEFKTKANFSIVVKNGVVVDYGFETQTVPTVEVVPVVAVEVAQTEVVAESASDVKVEDVVVEETSVEVEEKSADVNEKSLEVLMAKIEQLTNKIETLESEKETAKEVAEQEAEKVQNLKAQKIVVKSPTVQKSAETHFKKTVGGQEFWIPIVKK